MNLPKPSIPLVLAGVLTGLIFVSPALSSRGPVPPGDVALAQPIPAAKTRPIRPAPKVAQAGLPCAKTRRSLWVDGEGWVVRRVSVCR